MPRTAQAMPPGFRKLSVPERIDYVQQLWDVIAADADKVPVPGWHKQILDARLSTRATRTGRPKSWTSVRRRVENAIRSRRNP